MSSQYDLHTVGGDGGGGGGGGDAGPMLFQPNSTQYIEFITPHWGGSYPYGNTTVELLSSDVPIASVTFSYTRRGSDTIFFEWYQEWIKTDIATGTAAGGENLTVYGHGFDFAKDRPDLSYICHFRDPKGGKYLGQPIEMDR